MRTLVLAIALLATGSLAFGDDDAVENAPANTEPAATPAAGASAVPADSAGGETMDLGGEPDAFNPYNNERHPAWALLPAAAIALVLLHLRKSKPQPKLVKGP